MDQYSSKQWDERISKLLCEQLSYEYKAFYLYRASSAYFDQRSVELPGLKRVYKRMAMEELEHADGIIDYMNSRGYSISFHQVDAVSLEFKGIRDVVKRSLDLEEFVLVSLKHMYSEAEKAQDYATTIFLDAYIDEQVRSIKELSQHLMNAERCEDKLGEFLFDNSFRKKRKRPM